MAAPRPAGLPAVVDPRFAAGRGDEFSAGRQRQREAEELAALAALDGEDARLPRDQRVEENVDLASTQVASADAFIPDTNLGYRLLQKLGWTPGAGLGRDGRGIAEPVRLDANDNGARSGLGRGAVDRQFYAADLVQRRALETEVQAQEDEGRAQRREIEAERQARIREDVADALATFYCAICCKQYAAAMELEAHLSSYDHHHTKRMAETRAMLAERGRADRGRKERRAEEREAARLQAQIEAARRAAGGGEEPQAPPPPPPPEDEAAPPPPPPPPSDADPAAGGWGQPGPPLAPDVGGSWAPAEPADAPPARAQWVAASTPEGAFHDELAAEQPVPLAQLGGRAPAAAPPVAHPPAGRVALGGGFGLGKKRPLPGKLASVFGEESSDEDG